MTEYQTGLSILFVGYILGQIPSNLFLNWFGRPSLYLGFFTIAWGLVSALTALVQNFAGIVVCRFILGFVGRYQSMPPLADESLLTSLPEAPFFPGVLFYLSVCFHKTRPAIYFSGPCSHTDEH